MKVLISIVICVACGLIYLGSSGAEPKELKRFYAKFDFDDLPVQEIFHGKPAKIDYESHPLARKFKSVLGEASKKGPNFAGHYIFVSWGCGAPCVRSAVIDSKTGKVYPGPDGTLGYDFRLTSRLLKLNPPTSEGYYEDNWYSVPQLYVWNEEKKSFEHIQSAN